MTVRIEPEYPARIINVSGPSSFPDHIHHRRNQVWENWGRTARCQPEFSFYPQRVEDLIQIVQE